jgi:MFS transporter, MHS family, shikimate and dehydroshikimate transport protein
MGARGSSKLWVALAASSVGTVLEWYDFALYGAASALVFNTVFFPQFDPVAGTMAAFAAYAVGFVIRPLGGILFGNLGDRYGRKPVLLATLVLMGVSTTLIGLLPTYAQVGVWAPLGLVLLRAIQGLGAGAEYGGAILVAAESAPDRRGFYASFPAAAVDVSLVIATSLFALLKLMPSERFMSWGWRIPFLLGAVVFALSLYVRRRMTETDDFVRSRQAPKAKRAPLARVVGEHRRALLLAAGANVAPSLSYVFQIFSLSYAVTQLKLPASTILIGVLLSGVAGAVGSLTFGALSDRYGRARLILIGGLFTAAFAFPFFALLGTGIPAVIWFAVVVAHLGERIAFGAQPAFYAELFPVELRYTGIALAREVTGAVVAGPLPLLATALVAASGGAPWLVAGLACVMGLVTAATGAVAGRTVAQPATFPEPRSGAVLNS